MMRVDITGITLASILLILSCFVRAFRWQLLLGPFDHIPFSQVFGATMVGYFGNGVLAFRLGELLKAYSVTKNKRLHPDKLEYKKYDPVIRKHVLFRETK